MFIEAIILLVLAALGFLAECMRLAETRHEIVGGSEGNLPPAVVVQEDITGSIAYSEVSPNANNNQHIGQRKLFLNELQFMTRQVGLDRPAIIVYAGSAPCNKMSLLADLFPAAVFLLVDPNPFNVFPPSFYDKRSKFGQDTSLPIKLIAGSDPEGLSRVKIDSALVAVKEKWQDLSRGVGPDRKLGDADPRDRMFILNTIYTPEHSAAIRKAFPAEPVYLISDIRTNIMSFYPTDLDIVWNFTQQYLWAVVLKPVATMIKWRRPFYATGDVSLKDQATLPEFVAADLATALAGSYTDQLGRTCSFDPIDFLADYHSDTPHYPAGEVFIQPWAKRVSTETRLVFKADAPVIAYDSSKDYDAALFYYNTVMRPGRRLVSARSRETVGQVKRLNLDHCNDCALESAIWEEYLLARDRSALAMTYFPQNQKRTIPGRICDMISLLVAATGHRKLHPGRKPR